jgi:hypothetical protein
MLSAKNAQGEIRYAHHVLAPRAATFYCPRSECNQEVSHVKAHDRSLKFRVAAHFRHKAKPGHPEKHFSWQIGNVVSAVLEAYNALPSYEVTTDRVFQDPRTGEEYYAELSIRDKLLDRETVVRVESDSFNAEEFHSMARHLSGQGKYTALVLSARGDENRAGKFYRDDDPVHRPGVKKIAGNEKAVWELMKRNIYFDHDTQEFVLADFQTYTENRKYNPFERVWKDGITVFETLKRPKELGRGKVFVPTFQMFQNGLRVSYPRMVALDVEHRAAAASLERIVQEKDREEQEELAHQFCVDTQDFADDDWMIQRFKAWREMLRSQRDAV